MKPAPFVNWDQNRGTYLAIALGIPYFLTLFANIIAPRIPGLYTVSVEASNGLGEIRYGTWGLDVRGLNVSG
jgi:hypothetical protein